MRLMKTRTIRMRMMMKQTTMMATTSYSMIKMTKQEQTTKVMMMMIANGTMTRQGTMKKSMIITGVMLLTDRLGARRQTTSNLLANLFKGYKTATDKVFPNYITQKQESYKDRADISPHELELSANKYKNIKVNGKWNAPAQNEEKILARQAEV